MIEFLVEQKETGGCGRGHAGHRGGWGREPHQAYLVVPSVVFHGYWEIRRKIGVVVAQCHRSGALISLPCAALCLHHPVWDHAAFRILADTLVPGMMHGSPPSSGSGSYISR